MAPGVLVHADHPHPVQAVGIVDEQLPPGGKDRVVDGVPGRAEPAATRAIDSRSSTTDFSAHNTATAGDACGRDVGESEDFTGARVADGPAHEPVVQEHADLAEVAGVVADGDPLPDVGRQRGCEVAQALEVDPVAVHGVRGRDHHQEQVEFSRVFGGIRGSHPCPSHAAIGVCPISECTRRW